MNKFVIIALVIFSVVIFCFSNKILEGLAPNSSPNSNVPSGSDTSSSSNSNVPSGSKGNPQSTLSTSSALDKFTSALVSAFSPPDTASSSKSIAKPAWTNVKQIADPVTLTKDSSAGCKNTNQVAVDPLPVDVQAQGTVSTHSTAINSILDKYELQLSKFEAILNKPKIILALNKNVDSVVNLGVPSVSVVYDETSNSLINLSVVKGIPGDKGSQPDPIAGIPVRGDIGSAGVAGINPIGNSIDELPYWAKP